MVTGCDCGWNGDKTSRDAFMVQGLRQAGVIILDEASLDESTV